LIFGIDAFEEVVPELDEEAAVVGFVHGRFGVVAIMLKGRIDNPLKKIASKKIRLVF
jgi:hypothetical protein